MALLQGCSFLVEPVADTIGMCTPGREKLSEGVSPQRKTNAAHGRTQAEI